jgi:hypothetical protein
MIWQVFYDFIFTLLEGSEFAVLISDLFALFVSLIFIYLIIVIPVQIFIRWVIRFISALTDTPMFYSMKKRYNRAPKE